LRFVLDQDEEMLKTIQFSARLAKGDKLLRYFKEKSVGPDAADWCFYSGLLYWKMMDETRQTQKKHEYLVSALECLEDACRREVAHWPAMFLRSSLVTMLSGDDVDEMCAYLLPTDYTLDDADRERSALVAMQLGVRPEPYFFIPYAAIAQRKLEAGDKETALRILDEGLDAIPCGRVKSLSSLLLIPVIMLYRKLGDLGLDVQKTRVKDRFNALFPAHKLR
jgi:hypothetical protein